MTSAYDDIRELQEEVQRLQRALHFWLPSVPADGPEDIATRIANDANLLVGYEPDGDAPIDPKDAETLGWIRLTHAVGVNEP